MAPSRSGTLRSSIGPVRARLLTNVNSAEKVVQLPLGTDVESCQKTIDDINEVSAKIRTGNQTISVKDQQWQTLIMNLDDEDLAAEEKLYTTTALDQKDGYQVVVEYGKDVLCRLERRLSELNRHIATFTTAPPTIPKDTDTTRPTSAPQPIVTVKLPKLVLPTFSGNHLEWPNFWNIFSKNIHDRNISGAEKFAYLLGQLTTNAREPIDGIAVTDNNYQTAVDILRERFERSSSEMIGSLYSQLKRIPKASDKVSDVTKTFDSCEKIFRQLQTSGEDVDSNRSLVLDVLSKFPTSVVSDLMKLKNVGKHSSLKEVREALKSHVRKSENFVELLEELDPFNGNSAAAGSRTVRPKHDSWPTKSFDVKTPSDNIQLQTSALAAVSTPRNSSKTVNSQPTSPCYFCRGKHFNSQCTSYDTVDKRRSRLTELGRCTRCLSDGHVVAKCSVPEQRIRCYFCSVVGEHPSPLCSKRFTTSQTSDGANINVKDVAACVGDVHPQHSALTCMAEQGGRAYLPTAVTTTVAPDSGLSTTTRILFDTASHRSYITEECARKLRLSTVRNEAVQVAVFGTTRTLSVTSRVVSFFIKQQDGSEKRIQAHTTPLITDCSVAPGLLLPSDNIFIDRMGYAMAEPFNSSDGRVDILIGSDFFWEFISGSNVATPSGLFLVPSTVGYLLGGRSTTNTVDESSPTLLCLTETCGINTRLGCGLEAEKRPSGRIQPDIEQFWALEKIGISDDPVTKDDDIALKNFNDTVYFQGGRYHVKWPWKDIVDQLPSNYDLALGRFKSLAKRLRTSDPSVLSKYQEVIDQQIRDGIIEKVTMKSESSKLADGARVHYLPHHPVIKPNSATTKVRIVYDASAKTRRDNPSLNECLHRGPVLLPDLCGVLLRFRIPTVAVIADVEKAFLQICLQPDDRDVTRFLWFDDPSNLELERNVAIYRFLRVPFGIISSPFLLGATVLYHLKQQKDCWVSKLIAPNTYVDNAVTGCDTDDQAVELYETAKSIFQTAGMNLQEWSSNSSILMNHIPAHDKAKQTVVKVLGMVWDSTADTLKLNGSLLELPTNFTKRSVLHIIAGLYDPLGLFQPVFVKAKRFLQVLWQKNLLWDESLSAADQNEMKRICDDIKPVFNMLIPRNPVRGIQSAVNDVVVFCDASKIAYAACVFIRKWDDVTKTFVPFMVYSKNRLAPGKKGSEVSLPRLELLGVVIGARAANFVREAFHLSVDVQIHLFTDSQCVLSWLQTSKPLSVFVENRVREMKRFSNIQFHYVRTFDNPADYCTRGMTALDFQKCQKWWSGPTWLTLPAEEWEMEFECSIDTAADAATELRKTPLIHHTLLAGEDPILPLGIDINTYSSFRKLRRVSIRCLKFLKQRLWNRLSANTQDLHPRLSGLFDDVSVGSPVTRAELNRAKMLWVRSVQEQHFAAERAYLAQDPPVQRPSSLIRQLGLGLDPVGVLRCYGRFEHADLPVESIQPVLLPKSCTLTNLIVRDIHERLLHSGVAHTLSQVRREYWIPQGRMVVGKIRNGCLFCRKYNGGPYALPRMPPWPRERMSPSSPFRYTGLDYLGPISVRIAGETCKIWVCLFTCLAVRAVHLEWVLDCSAKEFLDCVTRFISRRGTPDRIISDNAPQFRVVKSAFDRIWHSVLTNDDVMAYAAENGIDWSFITELAPWQGGFYERLVSLVKRAFRFAIGRRLLRWSEFATLCCEVEALINTRPITYVHRDMDSGRALRPVDFLTDLPIGTPATPQQLEIRDFGEAGRHLLQYWKYKQSKLQSLWEFWRSEYLLSLRERGCADHRRRRGAVKAEPKVDEVVLVKDADAPRGAWKLGRVIALNHSKDGAIRSVVLELPNKVQLRRSVDHLYPIEVPPAVDSTTTSATADEDEFDGFTADEVNEVMLRVGRLRNNDVNETN